MKRSAGVEGYGLTQEDAGSAVVVEEASGKEVGHAKRVSAPGTPVVWKATVIIETPRGPYGNTAIGKTAGEAAKEALRSAIWQADWDARFVRQA